MNMLGGEEMELGKQIKKHRQEVQYQIGKMIKAIQM